MKKKRDLANGSLKDHFHVVREEYGRKSGFINTEIRARSLFQVKLICSSFFFTSPYCIFNFTTDKSIPNFK